MDNICPDLSNILLLKSLAFSFNNFSDSLGVLKDLVSLLKPECDIKNVREENNKYTILNASWIPQAGGESLNGESMCYTFTYQINYPQNALQQDTNPPTTQDCNTVGSSQVCWTWPLTSPAAICSHTCAINTAMFLSNLGKWNTIQR